MLQITEHENCKVLVGGELGDGETNADSLKD